MDVSTGYMTITGLDEIAKRLNRLAPTLSKQVQTDALKKGAKIFQAYAIEKAPMSEKPHILKSYANAVFKKYTSRQFGTWIQPGNLKKNIRVKLDREGTTRDQVRVVVYIAKGAWYGKFQEFGVPNSGIERQSFMRPSFDTQNKEATKAVIDHLHRVLQTGGFVK